MVRHPENLSQNSTGRQNGCLPVRQSYAIHQIDAALLDILYRIIGSATIESLVPVD